MSCMSDEPGVRMHEIRWHGRGGQGAVTSSKILAEAAFRSGWSGVTAAPSFGAERRGAPITASTRMDREPIRILSQVTTPDVVVVLDDSLLAVANPAAGLKPGGVVIVNTVRPRAELAIPADVRVVTADVTGSALLQMHSHQGRRRRTSRPRASPSSVRTREERDERTRDIDVPPERWRGRRHG
ncbi:MAG: pyruvate ferredoxin oxidoreductase, gamma subunit [Acidimicrobiaceae bacterium]|nr:MAG: pyruvate ferredoxin oxidoreductase, gamma subunit [Acidimicrobiaceae bacterium]